MLSGLLWKFLKIKMLNKYLVKVETNWCGEDNTYSAIVDDERWLEFEGFCQDLSYTNFSDYSGFDGVLEDLFPDHEYGEEYSDEEIEEAYQEEPNYYSYTIEPFEGDDEEWNWYDLVWDNSK